MLLPIKSLVPDVNVINIIQLGQLEPLLLLNCQQPNVQLLMLDLLFLIMVELEVLLLLYLPILLLVSLLAQLVEPVLVLLQFLGVLVVRLLVPSLTIAFFADMVTLKLALMLLIFKLKWLENHVLMEMLIPNQ